MMLSLVTKANTLVSEPPNGVYVVGKYFGHVQMDFSEACLISKTGDGLISNCVPLYFLVLSLGGIGLETKVYSQ